MKLDSKGLGVLGALVVLLGLPAGASPSDTDFMNQVNAAMTKMMAGMSVAPSGNVDKDFVATMVPHHQGAIDMARAELRYGQNEQLRRLAQEIIVTQHEEIAAMRLAVGETLPHSTLTPERMSEESER
jgi:uncharacterized protein (DUF305 family)